MAVQSLLLPSAAGIATPSRTFRQSLGAMYRPAAAALAAAGGALYGPAGTMGELTLVTETLLRVAPATWVVNGTRNTKQGQYVVPNDETVDLAVPAKDAAQARRALIAVTALDSQEDGTANTALNNRAVLQVIPGNLAASNPALPGTPANTLLLGELTIPSTASGQPVTITRYDPRTTMRGGVLPVVADALTFPGHGGAPPVHDGEYRWHPTLGPQIGVGGAWRAGGLGGAVYQRGAAVTVQGAAAAAPRVWVGMYDAAFNGVSFSVISVSYPAGTFSEIPVVQATYAVENSFPVYAGTDQHTVNGCIVVLRSAVNINGSQVLALHVTAIGR